MSLEKRFRKLDEAKAQAAAQSRHQLVAWVVDHVGNCQEEDVVIVVGASESDAPGDFVTTFVNGAERRSRY